jgi:hypothetical protein
MTGLRANRRFGLLRIFDLSRIFCGNQCTFFRKMLEKPQLQARLGEIKIKIEK